VELKKTDGACGWGRKVCPGTLWRARNSRKRLPSVYRGAPETTYDSRPVGRQRLNRFGIDHRFESTISNADDGQTKNGDETGGSDGSTKVMKGVGGP